MNLLVSSLKDVGDETENSEPPPRIDWGSQFTKLVLCHWAKGAYTESLTGFGRDGKAAQELESCCSELQQLYIDG